MAAALALARGLNVTGSTEMDMAPPHNDAPRFYPVNFHPEFGYLCPRPLFRQRTWSACKAAAFGVIVGAIAVIALVPRNHTAEVALIRPSAASSAAAQPAPPAVAAATETAYGNPCRTTPWPYAGTGCLAQTPAAWEPVRAAAAQPAADPVVVADVAPDPAVESAAPPADQKSAVPAKKFQKTVKRDRRKQQEAREPDPRSAYAGRFADRRPQAYAPNNGWNGFGGGGGGGWRW
jgi:hypothetical protein